MNDVMAKIRIFLVISLISFMVSAFTSGNVTNRVVDSEVSEYSTSRKRITHVVIKGEGLTSILKRYGVSLSSVLKSNRWLRGSDLSLKIGDEIVILRKDMNKATALQIDREIRLYGESYRKNEGKEISSVASKELKLESKPEVITPPKDYIESPVIRNKEERNQGDVKVAILLPLYVDLGVEDAEFASFYKGALIALEELKAQGVSTTIDVIDTGNGIQKIDSLISNRVLLNGYHLVIGPVYPQQFTAIAHHLRNRNVALISPLTPTNIEGDNIFQVSQHPPARYDKLEGMLDGKNVIMYRTEDDDTAFFSKMDLYSELAERTFVINKDSVENVEYVLSHEAGKPKFLGTLNELIRFRAGITDSTEIRIEIIEVPIVDSLAMDSLAMDSLSMDSLMVESEEIDTFASDSLATDSLTTDSLATDSVAVNYIYRIRYINPHADSLQNDTMAISDTTNYINEVVEDIPLYSMEFISHPDLLMEHAMRRDIPNVVVVGAKESSDIERIMSKISILNNNFDVTVIGSSEFARISDEKRRDFFVNDTRFITGYHSDRFNKKSLSFETKYVDTYGELPSLFSYRAYDVVSIFVSLISDMDSNFMEIMDGQLLNPMRAGYRFVKVDGKYVNVEWMLVRYLPDYTVEIR